MAATRKSRSTDPVAAAVGACLARHCGPQEQLVVGLSGGVDSVVLLHALCAHGVRPAAIHVHHGLSAAADAWGNFCATICADWGVALELVTVAVDRTSADGLEAAARRARHEVFAGSNADWILLGHHQGDRAETLLFNLLRGAGIRGAGALAERRGRILRPLLPVDRRAIVDYARGRSLHWVEDESNADVGFSRNFLRHNILKPLKQRFPAVEARLAAAAAHFAEAGELLDALAQADLSGREAAFPLDLSVLEELPEPRARNLLRHLLQRYGVGIPSEQRLREALRQTLYAGQDRHPAVTFGPWVLKRRAGQLWLESPGD